MILPTIVSCRALMFSSKYLYAKIYDTNTCIQAGRARVGGVNDIHITDNNNVYLKSQPKTITWKLEINLIF